MKNEKNETPKVGLNPVSNALLHYLIEVSKVFASPVVVTKDQLIAIYNTIDEDIDQVGGQEDMIVDVALDLRNSK